MKHLKILATLLIVALLYGCAGTPAIIKMDETALADKTATIAIAITKLPEPGHMAMGSQGLLDIAINESMAGDLKTHLKTIDLSGFEKITTELADHMRSQGYNVIEVREPVDLEPLAKFEKNKEIKDQYFADKDMRSLKQKLQADRVLLVSLTTTGTLRNYYGFIPTGAPTALTNAVGQMVDLSSNRLLWRQTVSRSSEIAKPWAQPEYTNVTTAVEKTLLMARQGMYNCIANNSCQ